MPSFEEIVHSLRHPDGESSQPLPRVTLGAVNKDGSFYYAKAFGEESDESLATDGVHFIASSTKFVTTVAVMQCVERGQLNLDADISDILPEWKNPQILTGFDEQDRPTFQAATKAITLRHLLTHSSGMTYVHMEPLLTHYDQLPGVEPRRPQSLKERFYTILVERVTSMRLGEYMKRYIFDVVSVHDATFHLEEREDLRERMVNQWERVGQELKIGKCPAADPVTDDLGGGGLYSTVTELLKIYHGVLSEKFLSRETIDLMFQPHLVNIPGLQNQDDYSISYRNAIYNAIPPSTPVSFGLGGLINLSPIPNRRSENSLSWSGMSNCYWWIDSKKGIAGVYLSQLVPTGDQQAIKLLTAFEKFVYMNIL
ncbi:beta-lactamase/transpeptidase-like protein [Fusarium oxysporum Fo47]|uniref:beta-lactamase/transpeptidase-like protein n=1 Tax=Fusarium oxysporum Fo47 TaxID=660027 RepID=UPI002869A13E|nr:beta-lactamase/transpeptidase-like protein [Fusarium oxysporum Fo47]QKD56858.2 beta-lactamase/transpeptidase-like protein [Fusarium oxysporum Fo47]